MGKYIINIHKIKRKVRPIKIQETPKPSKRDSRHYSVYINDEIL